MSACELSPGVRPLTEKSRWIIANIANTANIESRRDAANWKPRMKYCKAGGRQIYLDSNLANHQKLPECKTPPVVYGERMRPERGDDCLGIWKNIYPIEIRGFMNSKSMKLLNFLVAWYLLTIVSHLLWARIWISTFSSPLMPRAIGHSIDWRNQLTSIFINSYIEDLFSFDPHIYHEFKYVDKFISYYGCFILFNGCFTLWGNHLQSW